MFGGVQIIFAAFVDDADIAFLICLGVGDGLVDFAGFEVLGTAAADAEFRAGCLIHASVRGCPCFRFRAVGDRVPELTFRSEILGFGGGECLLDRCPECLVLGFHNTILRCFAWLPYMVHEKDHSIFGA